MSQHRAAAAEEPSLFDEGGGRPGVDATAGEGGGAAAMGESEAVRVANERADRLEAEMAELKELVSRMAETRGTGARREPGTRQRSAARVKHDAAEALSRAVHGGHAESNGESSEAASRHADDGRRDTATQGGEAHAKGGVPLRDGSSSGESEARRAARSLVDSGEDAGSRKEPPSPSSAEGEPGVGGGEEELRKDSMMAHLLDSLEAGDDIGHYGRLVFAMVARHFLSHDELLDWLLKDQDLGEEEARQMLLQVEGRDYSPPRRDRILQWQSEQEFAILPDVDDPDSGNVYRTLNFPKEIYQHIGHYREQKAEE